MRVAMVLALIGWSVPSGWPGTWPSLPQPPVCTERHWHNECSQKVDS